MRWKDTSGVWHSAGKVTTANPEQGPVPVTPYDEQGNVIGGSASATQVSTRGLTPEEQMLQELVILNHNLREFLRQFAPLMGVSIDLMEV